MLIERLAAPAAELTQVCIVRRKDDRSLPRAGLESPAIALHRSIEIVEIGILAIGGRIDSRGLGLCSGAQNLRVPRTTRANRRRLLLAVRLHPGVSSFQR